MDGCMTQQMDDDLGYDDAPVLVPVANGVPDYSLFIHHLPTSVWGVSWYIELRRRSVRPHVPGVGTPEQAVVRAFRIIFHDPQVSFR